MQRAIIVDDEELSVKRLSKLLAEYEEIEVSRTFFNPWEAYEYAKEHPIDIAFLDVSMPEVDGMKLSSLLMELSDGIQVVFVTGFDEYAVDAFERSALDYLLKPVMAKRLSKTMERIFKRRPREEASMPVQHPIMDVRLFNGLRIGRRGLERESIRLRSPKTEELFAYLICKRVASREEIIETLWSGFEPDKAWKNLNSNLYYIRKAISASELGHCILAGRNDIRINEDCVYADIYEFENVMKQIRQTPDQCETLYERAEALYTGELLKGKTYEWVGEWTRRLEQDYIEMLDGAARMYIRQNRGQKALHCFNEIVRLDAVREDIHFELIRLYREMGRKSEAIRQYLKLEELLKRELGTKPDPHIQNYVMSFMHT